MESNIIILVVSLAAIISGATRHHSAQITNLLSLLHGQ